MERTKADDELYLVLNLGLKSLRGIVFDRSGRVAFKDAHPIHSWVKGPFLEQEPGEWDAITDDILRELARDTLVARRIKAITVTASSACLVTVDRTGRSLTNAIMVSDTRATEEAALLSEWDVGAVLGRVTAYHMLPKYSGSIATFPRSPQQLRIIFLRTTTSSRDCAVQLLPTP